MKMVKVCERPVDDPRLCQYELIGGYCSYKMNCKYLHVKYINPARQSGEMLIGGYRIGGCDNE